MMEGNRIGIIGGGQLGRMLTQAAQPLGFEVTVVDPNPNCPAKQVGAEQIEASVRDEEAIVDLARRVDVVTWEIEHINLPAVMGLWQEQTRVEPSPASLELLQDKYVQKGFLETTCKVPVARHYNINSQPDLTLARSELGDVIIKRRLGSYDGRGNLVINDGESWDDIVEHFPSPHGGNPFGELYAEEIIPFKKELAVVAVRDTQGNVMTYPTVETLHADNICHLVLARAPIEERINDDAQEIALEVLRHLHGAGVFAVEMFLTDDNKVLVNEVAPRVHNSGHLTIEANQTSQFEQHVRAVTGLPLGGTEMVPPAAAMINILPQREIAGLPEGIDRVLELPDTHFHWYGKKPAELARKMGHITVRAGSVEEAKELALKAREELDI